MRQGLPRAGGWPLVTGGILSHPLAALAVLAALSLTGCSRSSSAETASARRMGLKPCRLDGVAAQTLCGTLEVFEDRAAAKGRKIPLRVVVVPALASQPKEDPLFFLAGGPGQAASRTRILPALDRIRRQRDIVFVDQRGTGDSHPLDCDALNPSRTSLAERFEDREDADVIPQCRKGWDADERLYTTSIAMDDLDDVRAALGYRQVNLWGISYGTRAALVYMRQHPDRVRTAILDGVAPMGQYLPLYAARDGQRALDLLLDACAKDGVCAKAYPDLRARTEGLLAKLEAAPAKVHLAHPRTGVPEDFTLTRRVFLSELFSLLYSPDVASLVPLMLDRAAKDDWTPFVALSLGLTDEVARTTSRGMFLAVVCAEDAPFFTEEDAEREAKGTWFGPRMALDIKRACAKWPQANVPPSFREPVKSDIPTLLLSGELDPVTPPPWGEEAKRTLTHSLHVVVPGLGHNTVGADCARTLMADVLTRGSVEGLTPDCGAGLKRPPFFTSFAGPVP
ncbi:alpha/beta hydrolase [Corallococcus coralloides]|uniref:alpha/beta hydrolase n=1 Tax=Corallococcus coralloides TaxID=184914 RepID=UPI0009FDF8A8